MCIKQVNCLLFLLLNRLKIINFILSVAVYASSCLHRGTTTCLFQLGPRLLTTRINLYKIQSDRLSVLAETAGNLREPSFRRGQGLGHQIIPTSFPLPSTSVTPSVKHKSCSGVFVPFVRLQLRTCMQMVKSSIFFFLLIFINRCNLGNSQIPKTRGFFFFH